MHIARGLYYGSYKSPRVLVWSVGVIIFIVMMATAFLGYGHSPKWFNISIFSILFILWVLGLVYYTILKKSNILICPALSLGPHIGDNRSDVNTMKNINYNKNTIINLKTGFNNFKIF